MAQHVYRLKKDIPDHRDHLFARPPIKLPSKVDLRPLCSPVVDQGQLGSCTANAIASGLREFMEIKAKEPFTALSRLFLYFKEREMEDTINEDAGAYIRDGMKILSKLGVCPESEWPYDISKFAVTPPGTADTDATHYRVLSYQRLNSLNDIKRCLFEGYPVVIGIAVYESFESDEVARTGIVPLPKSGEQNLGGHAVCVVGYEDTGGIIRKKGQLIVRNSWGAQWGDQGYFYLPYEFIRKYAYDFWTAR